ncbi:hypothetical protein GGR57DRAFT_368682 [Xylariaceae sp. FL1272]|nr:hypothetical protein GGR57DRAFT_368682 [Xylariaceae sp. FL1272]
MPFINGVRELAPDPTGSGTQLSWSLQRCSEEHPYAWVDFVVPRSIIDTKPQQQTQSPLISLPTYVLYMTYEYMGPMELLCTALTCKTLLNHRFQMNDLQIPSLALHRPTLSWMLESDGEEDVDTEMKNSQGEDMEMQDSEEDDASDDYEITELAEDGDITEGCELLGYEDYDMDFSDEEKDEKEEARVPEYCEASEDCQDLDADVCGAVFEMLHLLAPQMGYH